MCPPLQIHVLSFTQPPPGGFFMPGATMATTDLTLAAETSGPAIVLSFPGIDLTGHSLRMAVFWRGGGFELTSADGDLTLAVTTDAGVTTSRVTWAYSAEQSSGMPYGAVARYDLFATLSETLKISAGQINVDGPGRLSVSAGSAIEIPGIQGPRGWSPVYATPAYGTGVVLRVADWTGGAGDKPATGQYLGPAGWVDAIVDATLFATIEGAAAAIAAASASAETATTQAGIATTAAEESAGVLAILTAAPITTSASTYLISITDLGRLIRFTSTCVVTFPAGLTSGFYVTLRRIGGAVTWVAASGATIRTYPTGTGITAVDASVVASVDTNVGGSAAAWIIEGAVS